MVHFLMLFELWKEEKVERRVGSGTMIEKKLENGFDAKGFDGTEERSQIKEADTEVIAVCGVLSDTVTIAILCRIAERGGCARKELETLDAVVKEGEPVVRELRENGLIEVGDTITLTEKGKKVLAFIDELEDELIRR